MKKALSTLLILLLVIMQIQAAPFPAVPSVNPKDGGFGINLASYDYQGDKRTDDSTFEWQSKATGDTSKGKYSDFQMVGTGGVWNMKSDNSDNPMTITITCPNGFFFQSMSNEGARRPFSLILVIKESNSDNLNESGTNQNPIQEVVEVDSGESVAFQYNTTNHNSGWDADRSYRFMWFDLVLCLPFDTTGDGVTANSYVTPNGRMYVDKRPYDLVEADDYFALITLKVEWNNQIAEITIPLSGYYSRNPQNMDTVTSLSAKPRSSAGNLDIQSMAGQSIPIADISFMSTADDIDYYMFLSSSSNPQLSDKNGFRLTHSSVGAGKDPTIEEYLGFDLTLETTRSTRRSGSMGSLGSAEGEVFTFDGTDASQGLTVLPDTCVTIPYESNTNTGSAETYAQYEGTVSIIMDQPRTILKEGSYTEEVYVHILTDSKGGQA